MTIQAIVVKKIPVREYDLFVTLYTREMGKLSAVAKSALKAKSVQAAQLDAGNMIRCELVQGRGAPIITAAQSLQCWSGAKASPVRWAAAQFFLQVVDATVYDSQPDEALFACLHNALQDFDDTSDAEIMARMRYHQQELLNVMGYGAAATTDYVGLAPGRTELDDAYERIAQRTLGTLDLFYDLARR